MPVPQSLRDCRPHRMARPAAEVFDTIVSPTGSSVTGRGPLDSCGPSIFDKSRTCIRSKHAFAAAGSVADVSRSSGVPCSCALSLACACLFGSCASSLALTSSPRPSRVVPSSSPPRRAASMSLSLPWSLPLCFMPSLCRLVPPLPLVPSPSVSSSASLLSCLAFVCSSLWVYPSRRRHVHGRCGRRRRRRTHVLQACLLCRCSFNSPHERRKIHA